MMFTIEQKQLSLCVFKIDSSLHCMKSSIRIHNSMLCRGTSCARFPPTSRRIWFHLNDAEACALSFVLSTLHCNDIQGSAAGCSRLLGRPAEARHEMGIPLGPSLAVGARPWERRAVRWPTRLGKRGGVLRALTLEGSCMHVNLYAKENVFMQTYISID